MSGIERSNRVFARSHFDGKLSEGIEALRLELSDCTEEFFASSKSEEPADELDFRFYDCKICGWSEISSWSEIDFASGWFWLPDSLDERKQFVKLSRGFRLRLDWAITYKHFTVRINFRGANSDLSIIDKAAHRSRRDEEAFWQKMISIIPSLSSLSGLPLEGNGEECLFPSFPPPNESKKFKYMLTQRRVPNSNKIVKQRLGIKVKQDADETQRSLEALFASSQNMFEVLGMGCGFEFDTGNYSKYVKNVLPLIEGVNYKFRGSYRKDVDLNLLATEFQSKGYRRFPILVMEEEYDDEELEDPWHVNIVTTPASKFYEFVGRSEKQAELKSHLENTSFADKLEYWTGSPYLRWGLDLPND